MTAECITRLFTQKHVYILRRDCGSLDEVRELFFSPAHLHTNLHIAYYYSCPKSYYDDSQVGRKIRFENLAKIWFQLLIVYQHCV